MTWRRYPFESMWRDKEEMRAGLENMSQHVYTGGKRFPPGGVTGRMLPAIRREFRVDVHESDDEVIVVADLPGVEKEAVSLQLVNPRVLEISCERKGEKEERSEGFFVRERTYGSMSRIVVAPTDVTENNSSASFKKGCSKSGIKRLKHILRHASRSNKSLLFSRQR